MLPDLGSEERKRHLDQPEKGHNTDVSGLVLQPPHDSQSSRVVNEDTSSIHHRVGPEEVSRSSNAAESSVPRSKDSNEGIHAQEWDTNRTQVADRPSQVVHHAAYQN